MMLYEFEGKRPKIATGTFVHPQAVIIGDVEIATGCFIAPGAVLRGDFGRIVVGEGSNIQDCCVIHSFPDETVMLGPESHIGHGAVVHGAELARHVLIGMNAVVHDFARLGANSVVASGAVIPARMEVPARHLVAGLPARVVREMSESELARWRSATESYQELARRYIKFYSLTE